MRNVDTESITMPRASVNFVLGVGAQKAGTTWLHHFLSSHPEACMGGVKEYHVWNTLFPAEGDSRQTAVQRRGSKLERKLNSHLRSSSPAIVSPTAEELRVAQSLISDPDGYPKHFVDLARSRAGIKVVGDITPAYALLNSSAYSHVQGVLEPAGFTVKPVFILRDPVSRVISAYDMYRRRWNPKSDLDARTNPAPLEEFATWASVRRRTDYRHTVGALEQSFDVDGIFFGLFEAFFTRETIGRLLEFLNISWTEPPVERARNKSRTGFRASTQQREMLRETYADTYNFCFQRFPEWGLQRLWFDSSSVAD